MTLTYSVGETREKIREIQMNTRKGMMSQLINKASHESMYMISSKMLGDIIMLLPFNNVVEYDEKLKIYTMYNSLVPHFYGENTAKGTVAESMVEGAVEFTREYMESPELFSGFFTGAQQVLLGYLALHIDNRDKIREILRIV